MSNSSVQKIGRGIDRIESAKAGGPKVKLSNFSGAPASVSDLNRLAQQATQKRDRLRQFTAGIVTAVDQYRAKTEAEYADRGKEQTDTGSVVDRLGETQRRKLIEGDVSRFRRDALETSTDERRQLLSELREINRTLSLVKDGWTDPVAVLMRSTRGDSRRSVYAANLANSGPVEIENALRDAVLTGDSALAAAAFGRLDSLDKASRQHVNFSKREVAESLVHDEWTKARQFIAISEIAETEAAIADDEAEGKAVASKRKIGLGVRKTDLAKILGDDFLNPDSEIGTSSTANKRSAETFEQRLDRTYPGAPLPEGQTFIGENSNA